MTTASSTIIVGGGLSGLAAAVRLADAGQPVTLIETRKRLGGRATSFVDPETGQLLDNCQHVLMGACTNLLDLYERLGVVDRIRWHRAFHFIDGRGRLDTLRRDDLPAPLHLLTSLMGFGSLTWGEKWAILRAMMGVMQITPATRRQLDDRSFADWLRAMDQPVGAVEKFWSPIVTSACNETPERVSAAGAVQVFQQGFLQHNEACTMGLPAVPLAALYDTAVNRIERGGGRVRLGCSAAGFLYDAG
ncbi:MAG: FAD-dependent oxidoreductase, partial [Phycisphaeraceae bacterium]